MENKLIRDFDIELSEIKDPLRDKRNGIDLFIEKRFGKQVDTISEEKKEMK